MRLGRTITISVLAAALASVPTTTAGAAPTPDDAECLEVLADLVWEVIIDTGVAVPVDDSTSDPYNPFDPADTEHGTPLVVNTVTRSRLDVSLPEALVRFDGRPCTSGSTDLFSAGSTDFFTTTATVDIVFVEFAEPIVDVDSVYTEGTFTWEIDGLPTYSPNPQLPVFFIGQSEAVGVFTPQLDGQVGPGVLFSQADGGGAVLELGNPLPIVAVRDDVLALMTPRTASATMHTTVASVEELSAITSLSAPVPDDPTVITMDEVLAMLDARAAANGDVAETGAAEPAVGEQTTADEPVEEQTTAEGPGEEQTTAEGPGEEQTIGEEVTEEQTAAEAPIRDLPSDDEAIDTETGETATSEEAAADDAATSANALDENTPEENAPVEDAPTETVAESDRDDDGASLAWFIVGLLAFGLVATATAVWLRHRRTRTTTDEPETSDDIVGATRKPQTGRWELHENPYDPGPARLAQDNVRNTYVQSALARGAEPDTEGWVQISAEDFEEALAFTPKGTREFSNSSIHPGVFISNGDGEPVFFVPSMDRIEIHRDTLDVREWHPNPEPASTRPIMGSVDDQMGPLA